MFVMGAYRLKVKLNGMRDPKTTLEMRPQLHLATRIGAGDQP
jgi:hypothetical protein